MIEIGVESYQRGFSLVMFVSMGFVLALLVLLLFVLYYPSSEIAREEIHNRYKDLKGLACVKQGLVDMRKHLGLWLTTFMLLGLLCALPATYTKRLVLLKDGHIMRNVMVKYAHEDLVFGVENFFDSPNRIADLVNELNQNTTEEDRLSLTNAIEDGKIYNLTVYKKVVKQMTVTNNVTVVANESEVTEFKLEQK